MEDLSYSVGLGFSGADIPRALIITFFMAMLFAPQHSMWKLGFAALAIDKIIWPLISLAAAGKGTDAIMGSLESLSGTLVDDLGVYLVRYFGLTVLIGMFTSVFARLTGFGLTKRAAA